MLVVLWTIFFSQLWPEWWINEQYNFGIFVPLIGMYLIHLRWQDRPTPIPSRQTYTSTTLVLLTFVAIILYPAYTVFIANVDWRLLLWGEALVILATTTLLLDYWGGRPWVKHFILPFVFFLFSVPWPHTFEVSIVQGLMKFVAMLTVESMNFIGIFAIQLGNAISLSTGTVSVEEACSGVRSFQSTIMAGFFLGELMRFGFLSRASLIALAGLCSLFYNFCRTFLLTWIAASKGPETLDHWHDPAGYIVFLLSFCTLATLCYLISRRTKQLHVRSEPSEANPRLLHMSLAATLLVLLAGIIPASYAWYGLRSKPIEASPNWYINWKEASPHLEFREIPPGIKNVLFYDKGKMGVWMTPAGNEWIVYFFEWLSPEAAQLSGFHNPELCLPAVGWSLSEQGRDYVWKKENLELIFNTYTFEAEDFIIHVFNCEWDPSGYPYHQKLGRLRQDRLYDVWIADRKIGKKTLEIITAGYPSLEAAERALENFLEEAIVIVPPNGQHSF
ncbi:MAG: hypothetical protein Tsb0018_03060 [Opitutales bacterium]